MSLSELAAYRGVPVEQVIADIDVAIEAFRAQRERAGKNGDKGE